MTNIELSFPANLITELFKKNDIISILNIADQNIFFETLDLEGCNPLHLACIYGYDSLIEPFLNLGADINSINHAGDTPINLSILLNHLNITNILLKYNPDLSIADINGDTPLHKASRRDYDHKSIPLIQSLITHGANINCQNNFGDLPLHSSSLDTIDIVQHYFELGINLNSQNHAGTTILHTACQNGYLDLVNFLITKKVDIDLQDKNGHTPLHLCAIYAQNDIAQVLIHNNANLYLLNKNNVTPLDLSIHFKYPKITQLLQTYDNYLKINTALKRQSLSTAKKMKI